MTTITTATDSAEKFSKTIVIIDNESMAGKIRKPFISSFTKAYDRVLNLNYKDALYFETSRLEHLPVRHQF